MICDLASLFSPAPGVIQIAITRLKISWGKDADYVWHQEENLKDFDCVILPGGFSYGDYLRAGAIARFAPVMNALNDFAAAGGLVVGICNGFQVLCEAGLLPGVLMRNGHLEYRCQWTTPAHRTFRHTLFQPLPEGANPANSRVSR